MYDCAYDIKEGPKVYNRTLYKIYRDFPLMGHIAFGVIERGSNVIQVRPSTLCFHNCIFCSVDAGPGSRHRSAEYMVYDVEWLARWAGEVARAKGGDVEALIDGVGEPLTNPLIVELVRLLKQEKGIKRVAIETHGGSLSVELGKRLYEAGLDRINLSIDAIDPGLARKMVGVPWYNVDSIIRTVRKLIEETKLDIVFTPVIVPGLNDSELPRIISLARELRLGSRSGWPTGVLAQKYEEHKYGRRPPGVRPWSWGKFYAYLRDLEAKTGYKLAPSPVELGFRQTSRIDKPYKKGDKVTLMVVSEGWLRNEMLGVDPECTRVFSIVGARAPVGSKVRVKVIEDDNNIYIARPE